MPVVPFYFDLTTRRFTTALRGILTAPFTGKQGDIIKYELAILQGTPLPVDLGCVSMRLGIKDPKNLTNPYLSECLGAKSGIAQYARWQFALDLSNMGTLPPPTIASSNFILLAIELEILLHGQRIASPLQQFVLELTMGKDLYLICSGDTKFSITPHSAQLLWLTAASGKFIISGHDAHVNWLSAQKGTFTITGRSAQTQLQ